MKVRVVENNIDGVKLLEIESDGAFDESTVGNARGGAAR
jgi:hypothetical protein